MRSSWNVRLSDDEKSALVKAAALAKRTTGDFVRVAALAEAQKLIERAERKAQERTG